MRSIHFLSGYCDIPVWHEIFAGSIFCDFCDFSSDPQNKFPQIKIRDLSEISRGGGGVENGGGSEFFEPSKREGYEKKMKRKEGGSQKNKPPRS